MDSRVVFVSMKEHVEQGSTQVPGNVELVTNIYCLQLSSQSDSLGIYSFTIYKHQRKATMSRFNLRQLNTMFYFGKDDESFFDLQLHLGKYRLELGSSLPHDRGPESKSSD